MSTLAKNTLALVLLLAVWIAFANLRQPGIRLFLYLSTTINGVVFATINFKTAGRSEDDPETRPLVLRLLSAAGWGAAMSVVFLAVMLALMLAYLVVMGMMPIG